MMNDERTEAARAAGSGFTGAPIPYFGVRGRLWTQRFVEGTGFYDERHPLAE